MTAECRYLRGAGHGSGSVTGPATGPGLISCVGVQRDARSLKPGRCALGLNLTLLFSLLRFAFATGNQRGKQNRAVLLLRVLQLGRLSSPLPCSPLPCLVPAVRPPLW